MIRLALPFALAAAVSASAAAAPPVLDRWNVEFGPGTCRLERNYSAPMPATLAISTRVGTGDYSLSLAAPGFDRLPGDLRELAEVRIDGKKKGQAVFSFAPAAGGKGASVTTAGLRDGFLLALAGGKELALAGVRIRTGALPLPAIDKAALALRGCELDQMVEWGADQRQFAPGGKTPLVANTDDLVSQAVLKKLPWPRGGGPYLHVLLLDTQGQVARCSAVHGNPDPAFEKGVCAALLGRKIGEPARDPAGAPVAGVVTYTPGIIRRATFGAGG